MDVEPDPSEVPLELVQLIKSSDCWALLCQEWDQKYPTNPVLAVDHDGSDSKKEKAE